MTLSELIAMIEHEIGDRLEEDELDPRLVMQFNSLILEVEEVSVNGFEIVFKPRMAGTGVTF